MLKQVLWQPGILAALACSVRLVEVNVLKMQWIDFYVMTEVARTAPELTIYNPAARHYSQPAVGASKFKQAAAV